MFTVLFLSQLLPGILIIIMGIEMREKRKKEEENKAKKKLKRRRESREAKRWTFCYSERVKNYPECFIFPLFGKITTETALFSGKTIRSKQINY